MISRVPKCLICGEIIFSNYTHDFQECKCGSCFVDGGQEYFRCGYKNLKDFRIVFKLEDGTVVEEEE